MKRIVIATLLLFVFAFTLTPCSIASGANRQIQFPSWMWGGEAGGVGDWFKDGVAQFESEKPGVEVVPALFPQVSMRKNSLLTWRAEVHLISLRCLLT